jgi:hypothetical protein
MNIVAYGQKFFLFGGALLIAVAAVQVLGRPRGGGKASVTRLLDATTIRAILFVTVGVLAILAGAGVIPIGGGR